MGESEKTQIFSKPRPSFSSGKGTSKTKKGMTRKKNLSEKYQPLNTMPTNEECKGQLVNSDKTKQGSQPAIPKLKIKLKKEPKVLVISFLFVNFALVYLIAHFPSNT